MVVLYSEYPEEEGGASLLRLKSFRDIPMADVEVGLGLGLGLGLG